MTRAASTRDTIVDGRYRVAAPPRLGRDGRRLLRRGPPARPPGRAEAALPRASPRTTSSSSASAARRRAPPGLQHPNVVAVYDRGEWDGTYYIAMEYLRGPLAQAARPRGGAARARRARSTSSIQILRAARFAHRRGIIHRDLKPHNVIVDDEGRAKVTDFGIARAGASDMTRDGSIMGTAQYLSPEQAQGHAGRRARRTSTRSAIVLYELLTGRVPFDGESAGDDRAQAGLRGAGAAERAQPGGPARARGRRAARAGEGPGARASPTPTSSSPRCRPRATARPPAVVAPVAAAAARAAERGLRRTPRSRCRRASRARRALVAVAAGRRCVAGARRSPRVLLLPGTQKVAVPDVVGADQADAAARAAPGRASRSTPSQKTRRRSPTDQVIGAGPGGRDAGQEGLDGDAHRLRRAGRRGGARRRRPDRRRRRERR